MQSSKLNIGVIYPSRGLLYTETLKEVLRELNDLGAPYEIYWSHGNKLPSCFNIPLGRALKGSHSHILILEDDMVIKEGTLRELVEANEDVISCDYPLTDTPSGTVLYDSEDNALFTGTGFMLVKRHVFDTMPKPIFRSDIAWEFKQLPDSRVKFSAREIDPNKAYGFHDITFGLYRYINHEPIKVAKTVLAQRKLVQKGENSNNIGTDQIKIIDKYKKINCFMVLEEKIEPDNGLLVKTNIDGREVYVTKEFAKKHPEWFKETIPIENKQVVIELNNSKKAFNALRKI